MFRSNIRLFGIALQVVIYICNAFAWAVSILALTCGFVIGIGNDTNRISELFSDLGISTPATILIIYGFFLIIVTTAGCFSSVTAGIVMSIIYLILIVAYILFDIFAGYIFLFEEYALKRYYKEVKESLVNYGDDEAHGIGIFPVSSTTFWDHLQTRGKCCGLFSFEEWKDTNYSKKSYSIPDSCCNDEYSYRYCGTQVFRHPDTEPHFINNLLHNRGCIEIFPEALRLPADYRLTIVGVCIGISLIISAVLTCVILILVFTKQFSTEESLDNLDYVETMKNSEITQTDAETGEIGDGEQAPRYFSRESKIYPEEQSKKIKFKESGPQYIHDDYYTDPETSKADIRKFGQSIRRKVVSQGNDRQRAKDDPGLLTIHRHRHNKTKYKYEDEDEYLIDK